MEELFDRWAAAAPKYDKIFEPLFNKLAKKFGSSEEKKEDSGKIFNSNYELYMYAFFLGLYRNKRIPIEGEKIDFSHEIKHWGKKGRHADRKDYTILQRYMFMALVAKTDLDFIELDNAEEVGIKRAVLQLRAEFAEYTNTGLLILQEQYETDKLAFNNKKWFLEKIQQYNAALIEEN
nr:hypothetical protein [uncultured Marinifilum sp.]